MLSQGAKPESTDRLLLSLGGALLVKMEASKLPGQNTLGSGSSCVGRCALASGIWVCADCPVLPKDFRTSLFSPTELPVAVPELAYLVPLSCL